MSIARRKRALYAQPAEGVFVPEATSNGTTTIGAISGGGQATPWPDRDPAPEAVTPLAAIYPAGQPGAVSVRAMLIGVPKPRASSPAIPIRRMAILSLLKRELVMTALLLLGAEALVAGFAGIGHLLEGSLPILD